MENKESDEIGAIVANCNPFTKGHRYLVEYAASRCRYLHLFILSEEQEFISSDARFHMVSEGVKDLKNVILHRTSDYLISPVRFPNLFYERKRSGIYDELYVRYRDFSSVYCEKSRDHKTFCGK